MKCEEIQRMCIESGGKDLSAECIEHLVGCAPCRQVHERTVLVGKLLALKRHEHPDPLFETRNAAAIRKRLEAKPAAAGWLEGAWITGALQPWQGWAAGAVAACLALTAIWMTPKATTQPEATAIVKQQPALVPVVPQTPDPNDPAWRKPMLVLQDAGPEQVRPGDLRFGGSNQPSKAVDFQDSGPIRAQD